MFIRKLIKDKKGATAIEYGLIAALIAVAAITAMQGLGTQLGNTFNQDATDMKTQQAEPVVREREGVTDEPVGDPVLRPYPR